MKNNWPDSVIIQQYLEGKLDTKQMHELEKQALEDPFLFDALEGYANAESTGRELSILQRQLHERIAHQQENKKVFALSWQRLSIAAVAAVMFVSAGLLFWMNSQKADKKIASNSKQVEVNVTSLDSVKAIPPSEKKQESTAEKEERMAVLTPNEPESNPKQDPDNNELLKNNTNPIRSSDKSSASRDGIAKSEIKSPVSNDLGTFKSLNEVTKNNRTALAETPVRPKDKETINQNDEKEAPSEMPSASYGGNEEFRNTRKQSETGAPALAGTVTGRKPSEAQPAIGWTAYRQYLKTNAPKEQIYSKGRVTVEFRVNSKGKLSNFRIIEGLNKTCNAEAIRLIKEGPAWKISSGKTAAVRIDIEFNP